jgi:hypothetical protein
MDKFNVSNLFSIWHKNSHSMFGMNINESKTYLNYLSREFEIEQLTDEEHVELIKDFKNTLASELKVSGKNRKSDWEIGWQENANLYLENRDTEQLKPKYFGKYPFIRIDNKWINPKDSDMEIYLLSFLVDLIVEKFYTNTKSLYEFGCGTGHHLIRIGHSFPNLKLTGLDWATSSQKIIDSIASDTGNSKLFSHNFDYFNPDFTFQIPTDSLILTIASLEQIGSDHEHFINYLLNQAKSVVVNIEPIGEVLSDSVEIESLSKQYFKKRNYLSGYLDRLRELETQQKIRIISVDRSYFGSFFIEGYTVIIWEKI